VLIGSAGPITPGVRALAEKLGPVDVAIIAYQVHAVADTQIGYTWPFIELFKPKLFLPAHHDAAPPAWVDLGLEPLFDRIRAELPGTAFLAPLYRSPICIAGGGPDKARWCRSSSSGQSRSPDRAQRNPGRVYALRAGPGFRCAQPRLRATTSTYFIPSFWFASSTNVLV
jgi:hypothetical protein